ncbi:DUF881 domain-containing protein [Clostridiaceae bacterium M8S5]|nr:DUF881 domain-containing protein [Clostridiaceae bacterium M8S5]
MKKIVYNKIILFIAGLVVGLFVIVQYRQGGFSYYFVSINSVKEMQHEIMTTKDEMKNLEKLISKKKRELKRIQDAVDKGNVVNMLNEKIANVKNVAGMSNLRGQGIMIRITDGNRENEEEDLRKYVVHDADILNIINDLKAAGAEAISIKGQRVLSFSEIQCGGPIIWVNRRAVVAPFVINVIGNPKQLYAAINAPGTNGDRLKMYLNISTKISDNIFVPKYNYDVDYDYAKPISEGD